MLRTASHALCHTTGTLLAMALTLFAAAAATAQEWAPAEGPLMTEWAAQVSPENVHPEYPRPQMVREQWENLNGLWQYAIVPKDDPQPTEWQGEILVPFAAESALSGVMKTVGEENKLWYRRTFELPAEWAGQRIRLNFGAVDWETTVWVNGEEVGTHRGGYDPFTFDITEALDDEGEQEIIVAVWDPTDASWQPRGKQVNNPHAIWYTPVTGIWQTVWIEPIAETAIERLAITPYLSEQRVHVGLHPLGDIEGVAVKAVVTAEGEEIGTFEGEAGDYISIAIDDPHLWSPDDPFLYDLSIELTKEGEVLDSVESYFGMRSISLGQDDRGITRILLNGEPLFQYGPLDQGYWPDGLYTAPTEEAMLYDLEVTKELGFNMVRKHVKVEPARWYYACDRMGLLVWQDMPSGDEYVPPQAQQEIQRGEESEANFRAEWQGIIDAFYNHPCIVVWVPFNEGWGQFKTEDITRWTWRYDATRLVDSASGWSDWGTGDLQDIHVYPGPGIPALEEDRAAVLGEFGGLGLPVEGHVWQDRDNWGYRTYDSPEALADAYVGLIRNLRPLIDAGLCAAVYTQTTDVEIEVNGLLTYDRAVLKPDAEAIARANRSLYLPPPRVIMPIAANAGEATVQWRYTTEDPGRDWEEPEFEDDAWEQGAAGFGSAGTPGATVGTEWTTGDIWLRQTFAFDESLLEDGWHEPLLLVHHDEDAEVYFNGVLAAELPGYTTGYVLASLTPEAQAMLASGEPITIAIHCKQTGGGQYIDLGIVDQTEE